MRGTASSENYPPPQPKQQPPPANQQNQIPAVPLLAPIAPQLAHQPVAYRQQPQRACFNCGDPSHFVKDCPMKDRARKLIQQQEHSCNTNPSGGWTCPSCPHGTNHDNFTARLPVQGTAFGIWICGAGEDTT